VAGAPCHTLEPERVLQSKDTLFRHSDVLRFRERVRVRARGHGGATLRLKLMVITQIASLLVYKTGPIRLMVDVGCDGASLTCCASKTWSNPLWLMSSPALPAARSTWNATMRGLTLVRVGVEVGARWGLGYG
jgi:hypothetical protein